MSSLRIYSEMLPYADLVRPRTLALLGRYGLELVLAVRPWNEPEIADVARALRDAGVSLSIWPMLGDAEGRWANVHNAKAFGALTLSICDVLVNAGCPPRDVLFDLEPPFAQAQSLAKVGAEGVRAPDGFARLAASLKRTSVAELRAAGAVVGETIAELGARSITTSMAVWPFVALDPPGEHAWQSVLGTPVDALGSGHHVSVMMYTSMLEGWSRGALRRRDTTALLAAATVRALKRWGDDAGMSLGCVGTGAFHDEPVYRDPSELAEDVAVVRAAGCSKLALFDLNGVLEREPAEAWLDAFTSASVNELLPNSKRVRAARTLARAATWALGWPKV